MATIDRSSVSGQPVQSNSKQALGRPVRVRKWSWRLPVLIVVVAGIAAYQWHRSQVPAVVKVATATVQELKGSFTAEAVVKSKEYPLGPEVSGRIESILVQEGDVVRPGQLLLRVSSDDAQAAVREAEAAYRSGTASLDEAISRRQAASDELAAKIFSAKARVAEAKANLQRVQAGSRREEVSQGEHRLERARVARLDAERAYARAKTLFDQGAIPKSTFEAAEARLNSILTEVKEAEDGVALLKAGARPEDIRIAQKSLEAAQADLSATIAGRTQVGVYGKAVDAAESAVGQASASLSRLRQAVRRCELRAPVSGVVTKLPVEVGMVASAGAPVITLSTRKDLRIEAEISSEDAGKIREGMPVTVTSAAYPGRVFQGKVTSVLPVGELKPDAAIRTRIIRTRIALESGWELFRSGMELDIEGTAILKKSLCVPSDAVNLTDKALVFVVSGEVVREREVELGYSNAEVTEITKGLKAGEQVVISGKEGLADNAKVKVEG